VLVFYCTCYVRCSFCKGTLSPFWLLIDYWLLSVDSQTRGHSGKISKCRSKLNIRKYFFWERVVNRWNQLSQNDVDQTRVLMVSKECWKEDRKRRWTSSWTNCPLSPSGHIFSSELVWLHQVNYQVKLYLRKMSLSHAHLCWHSLFTVEGMVCGALHRREQNDHNRYDQNDLRILFHRTGWISSD